MPGFSSFPLALLLSFSGAANAADRCADLENFRHYQAHVTAVYDGDTITADVTAVIEAEALGPKTLSITSKGERFRLYGIDAPEMRGSERPAGVMSRDWLRARILDRELSLLTVRDRKGADAKGKYGRWLAILCDARGDVVLDMVRLKLAEEKYY